MALYAMADTHLSGSVPKSMEVFGRRWMGYTDKIERRWRALVTEDDTVVIPGDVSWATSLDEAAADFRFLDSLPGKKLIGKGNHDFWWTTVKKMQTFLRSIDVENIDFLYNNAYRVEDKIVCGTRGWFIEEGKQRSVNPVDYDKLVSREAQRLTHCLTEAVTLRQDSEEIFVFLHFPPVYDSFVCREIVEVLHQFNVRHCYYGHIHGTYTAPQTAIFEEIAFTNIAADYLDFHPLPIRN